MATQATSNARVAQDPYALLKAETKNNLKGVTNDVLDKIGDVAKVGIPASVQAIPASMNLATPPLQALVTARAPQVAPIVNPIIGVVTTAAGEASVAFVTPRVEPCVDSCVDSSKGGSAISIDSSVDSMPNSLWGRND